MTRLQPISSWQFSEEPQKKLWKCSSFPDQSRRPLSSDREVVKAVTDTTDSFISLPHSQSELICNFYKGLDSYANELTIPQKKSIKITNFFFENWNAHVNNMETGGSTDLIQFNGPNPDLNPCLSFISTKSIKWGRESAPSCCKWRYYFRVDGQNHESHLTKKNWISVDEFILKFKIFNVWLWIRMKISH